MIEANLRLVSHIAQRYNCPCMTFEDLVQEGTIGLITAVERYDPAKGCRFSTYAAAWIRQAITRAIHTRGRMIRLPEYASHAVACLERCRIALSHRLGRAPSVEELAAASGIRAEAIPCLLRSTEEPLSLDALEGEDEDTPVADFLQDRRALSPELGAVGTHLSEALQSLDARERSVIEQRYGFADGQVHSLAEIGRAMGLSRERVRQIEERALRRLRQALGAARAEEERPAPVSGSNGALRPHREGNQPPAANSGSVRVHEIESRPGWRPGVPFGPPGEPVR